MDMDLREVEEFIRRGVRAQQAAIDAGALCTFPPVDREEVIAFLKTVDDDLIYAESSRRLGLSQAHAVDCPICGVRQVSRVALRRHFQQCKKEHGSKLTLTGVIGEERVGEEWIPVRIFDSSDSEGKGWANRNPAVRRSRRVQRGSRYWEMARENESKLKGKT